jgi:hypothetical protein
MKSLFPYSMGVAAVGLIMQEIVGRFLRNAELIKLASAAAGALQNGNPTNHLTRDLQDRHSKMPVRLFVILIASWSVLSGCADTKQAAQADSNSVLRQEESDHEVHGEVGVMYGHTAR